VATVRKRGDRWRVEVYRDGKRKSKTCSTKTEAILWGAEEEKKLELMANGMQPETLFSDVIKRYLNEVTPTKRGEKHEFNRLTRFLRHPITDKYISDVTCQDLELWIKERLETVKGESVRRELSTIGHIFKVAVERWGYIQNSPMTGLQQPQASKPRTQRFAQEDIDEIVKISGYNESLKTAKARTGAAMLFAVETAMRAGEICNLTWNNVNLEKRTAFLPLTKNGSSRTVPLTKAAVKILERLRDEIEQGDTCFQVKSNILDATFRKLKKAVNREYLHFHDTRREALTRLAKKVDVMTLAKISGHKDIRILQNVYYAPNMEEVAELLD
jgi:putative integrase/recombinase HI_1414